MIIVTGAAGFIGSCLVRKLNEDGHEDLILVDDFSHPEKERNLADKRFISKVERETFFDWFAREHAKVNFVFHLGARTDTTEFRKEVFDHLNLDYSKKMWNCCVEYEIPLVYASSAATYGAGEFGYKDEHTLVDRLKPLNPYGDSKNDFDRWVLVQEKKLLFWAGLKFFNVFGPNEYHKGRMASVVFHAFNQIKTNGAVKLFRSHRPDFKDGEQLRDFVYVKDVTEVCLFLMRHQQHSGLYNLGSGKARTFLDLVKSTFQAMELQEKIEFIDTPEDIRDTYQYFTEADMTKLKSIGYVRPFTTLEAGVKDYVSQYLMKNTTW